MLRVDGSTGGGQILRSALSASLATRTPFEITEIRSRRPRPGLRHQHLAAVRLAAAVGGAGTRGAELGSDRLVFRPDEARGGEHHQAVGTAGSACLALQTVLVPLVLADRPATVTVTGGTHNRNAPPFDFLDRVWAPRLRDLGAELTLRLERHGFEPAGGGRITATTAPSAFDHRLALTAPGDVLDRRAHVLLASLPRHVAERELEAVREELGWPRGACTVGEVEADGAGNALLLEVVRTDVTELVTGFGRQGVPAEQVAGEAIAELRRYLDPGVAVGAHLADQLLLPLALGAGGTFTTVAATDHLRSNAEVVRRFVDVRIDVEETGPRSCQVTVR